MEQDPLGWNPFFDGFITDSWLATQHTFLTFIQKKAASKRWASRFINQLWEIAWEIWQHHMIILETPIPNPS
jgi:hypothetical protein